MPYVITQEGGHVHMVLSGRLTVPEVVRATQQLDGMEQAKGSSSHRFVDITAVENLQLSFSDVHAFAVSRRHVTLPNRVRTAVVTSSAVQYGIARMFQLLNSQPQTEVGVFKDSAAARQWIEDADAPDAI